MKNITVILKIVILIFSFLSSTVQDKYGEISVNFTYFYLKYDEEIKNDVSILI